MSIEYLIKEDTLKAVANITRDICNSEKEYTPRNMVNAVNDIYEAGVNYGPIRSLEEYNTWWDNYQNTNKGNCVGRFAGSSWNIYTFKPQYDMKPTTAQSMFNAFNYFKDPIDLVNTLDELGVSLDFSDCTTLTDAFSDAHISRIGTIDLKSIGGSIYKYHNCFANSTIETIENMIFYEKELDYLNFFYAARNLVNLNATGVISNNGLDFSDCTLLSHDSLISINNCLKDFSGTDESRVIVYGTVNLEKLTEDEIAAVNAKGWTVA